MCLPALHPTRLGDLYYGVFQQAGLTTAAVAGTCPIVGVGGHFLGEWAVSVRKGGGAAGGSAGAQPSSLRRPVPCTRSPGGGVGFLSSLHGMACDQLLSLTMVDARGDVLVANPTTHSDLFKASCGGGGGNFGIVTSFTVKLVQVCGVVWCAVRCGAVRCGAVRCGAVGCGGAAPFRLPAVDLPVSSASGALQCVVPAELASRPCACGRPPAQGMH